MEVPWEEASRFGLMVTDENDKITAFQEKLRMPTVSIPELTQLESGKSIIRYFPPNGTAGFASLWVNAYR